VRGLKRILSVAAIAGGVIWVGDLLSVRYGFPGHRATFGSVTVTKTYAVPDKDVRKEEYFFPDPESQTCVNSLFPHFGYKPCWYLKRHATETVHF
jgi:hypothetical protein